MGWQGRCWALRLFGTPYHSNGVIYVDPWNKPTSIFCKSPLDGGMEHATFKCSPTIWSFSKFTLYCKRYSQRNGYFYNDIWLFLNVLVIRSPQDQSVLGPSCSSKISIKVSFTLTFIVCRVLTIPYFWIMTSNSDWISGIDPVPRFLQILAPAALDLLNIYWGQKIYNKLIRAFKRIEKELWITSA